jgi:hypothetical protein
MFSIALLLTPLNEAVTTAVPGETAVATPCVGDVLLTVAAVVPRQTHCAESVKSFVLPSE